MFELYREMTDAEKAYVRAVHRMFKAHLRIKGGQGSRVANLAWGFVRGFPYKRIERQTRTQVLKDGRVITHNKPNALLIAAFIVDILPELEPVYFRNIHNVDGAALELRDECPIHEWLANPDGAIPAPPPRPKKPYKRVLRRRSFFGRVYAAIVGEP